MSTETELTSAHKKALKSLEGEKRAAIKKAKALKGKKGKEALASTETEYEQKKKDLVATYEAALSGLKGSSVTPTVDDAAVPPAPAEPVDTEQVERERKMEKARRKKEKQKGKEMARLKEIEKQNAEAGPSARQIELDALASQLTPLQLQMNEIPSDGHCLYRAVAAQLRDGRSYTEIRNMCATMLEAEEQEFSPFAELTEDVSTFAMYVDRVRNSSDWGGHLELRALHQALKRSIVVYSAVQPKLVLGEDDGGGDPIRLSYHLHYYSLGEHYNQVVAASDGEEVTKEKVQPGDG